MKVLVVEPKKAPYVKDIDGELESLQDIVGGLIETFYPFDDDVAVVCNDEGKINGSEPNRALYDDSGDLVDIIFGTFFIAGCGEYDFEELTDEQIKIYTDMFKQGELFLRYGNEIKVIKM